MPGKKDKPQQANDRAATPTQPQAFDPSILIAPGIAAIKYAWDIRKDIKEAEAPEFPLSLAILDSFAREQRHVIRVRLRNTTDCGIYLDSMTVTPPVDQRLAQSILEGGTRTPKVHVTPENTITHGAGGNKGKSLELPGLLRPQSTAALDIDFGLFSQQHHRSHPYALLKIEYSKLNETGPAEISFVVRLRWEGE